MAYTAKDYSKLVGIEGFSETLLKNHFTLYQGYVTNTNRLLDSLAAMLKEGKIGTPEYAELKRRLGFELMACGSTSTTLKTSVGGEV
jgi:Fe-Mn family superoxide dismutase